MDRMQKSILPPSNSYIGNRFNIPKKSDALIKSEKNALSVFKNDENIKADIKFTSGPEKQRIISFL